MRLYMDYTEALGEIKRDLGEMGIVIHPKTYQNKDISQDPNFEALELRDYMYCIINPQNLEDLQGVTQPWADLEFNDRISGVPLNPGTAWSSRKEVWTEFLDENGKLDGYSYPERINCYGVVDQIQAVIEELKINPDSRQCYISIWNPLDINNIGGRHRVPCTLGYQVQVREGKVNLTYLQRSADFATHLPNDIYLAVKLQCFIAEQLALEPGTFTHWVGSLHLFRKDAQGIF